MRLRRCDVLVGDRSPGLVTRFLDHFLPRREQSAAEYELPRFSDAPQTVFRHPAELMRYCAGHPHESHAIYWRNTEATNPAQGMVFFTSDGELILGLSSAPALAEQFLADLKAFAGSVTGYIAFESPPPGTAAEFRDSANR